jgi:cytochrome c-type biogenesis protein CcmE
LSSKVKFLIGGVVIVAVIGVLIATSFGSSSSDYLSIAQVRQLGSDQIRDSRVAGKIVPDSVSYSTRDVQLTFQVQDDTGTLAIVYKGPKPDMLVDAVEAVAIGKYDPSSQVFVADELLMKCPSKYEEKGQ